MVRQCQTHIRLDYSKQPEMQKPWPKDMTTLRHGTAEWLPGRPLGNLGSCWPDQLLGGLPNVSLGWKALANAEPTATNSAFNLEQHTGPSHSRRLRFCSACFHGPNEDRLAQQPLFFWKKMEKSLAISNHQTPQTQSYVL